MCALNLGSFCSRRVQELLLNTVVRVVVQCANLDPASKAAQELRRRAHRSHRLGKDLDQAAWICLDVHVAVKPGLQTIPFCLLAAELRPPMNSWICASLAFSRIPDTAKFRNTMAQSCKFLNLKSQILASFTNTFYRVLNGIW